jgi:NSS family neurotransmitter:Na+ symporter
MDVSAALMATLIIIPAVFVVGADLSSGPPLMFITMPEVFKSIAGTRLVGSVFFFSIYIIAMLSMVNAVEVLVAAFIDGFAWTRTRALALIFFAISVLSIPAMLSINFILKSDLIWGSTMQPLGTIIALVAITWVLGQARAVEEISRNSFMVIPAFLYYWIKFVIPVVIVAGLVYGWIG